MSQPMPLRVTRHRFVDAIGRHKRLDPVDVLIVAEVINPESTFLLRHLKKQHSLLFFESSFQRGNERVGINDQSVMNADWQSEYPVQIVARLENDQAVHYFRDQIFGKESFYFL